MRVAIVTDPPTKLESRRGHEVQFGGSFVAIYSLRRALQEQGHNVEIFINVSDESVVSELDYVRISRQDEPDIGLARQVTQVIGRGDFNAIVMNVSGKRMLGPLSKLLQALDTKFRPEVFVTAGPKAADVVRRIAAGFHVRLHVLERPGVARITRRGRDYVVRTLQGQDLDEPGSPSNS